MNVNRDGAGSSRSARSSALRFFSVEEVARSRRYHRPLYWAAAAGLLIDVGLLALLAWTSLGVLLDPGSLPWWARTPVYAAIVVVSLAVARTPLAAWGGLVRERRWGFSTQRFSGWLVDRAKGVAVNALLAAATFLGLVALARALPGGWVVPATAGFALAVLLLSFVAPVVLEPLFNRYVPLDDEALAGELRVLAERAGLSVGEVLVQDASRRTRKANAYVSGLGKTRRVVVTDTLLEQATEPEVRVVVAHELGHRRARHVLLGTLLAMAGAGIATVVVWVLLGTTVADPHRLPLVLLIGLVGTVVSLPVLSAVSRRWERSADRFALELTGDRGAYLETFRRFARVNLSDLDPPPLVYLLLFSHPTPAERMAAESVS
jgi:Zn-dependent protease with chaperone function